MGKKQILIVALTGLVTFGAGFFIRGLWNGAAGNPPQAAGAISDPGQADGGGSASEAAGGYLDADVLQVRVNDGDVEWFDGNLWHRVASVEELEANDKFYMAQEKYGEFEEQLRQEEAEQRQQQAGALLAQNQGELSVWQREAPKPTPKPASQPRPSTAAPAQTPGGQPAEAHNNDSNDDNDDDGGGSGGGQPAEEPEQPADGGADTGDGENMEWSDDYL